MVPRACVSLLYDRCQRWNPGLPNHATIKNKTLCLFDARKWLDELVLSDRKTLHYNELTLRRRRRFELAAFMVVLRLLFMSGILASRALEIWPATSNRSPW